MKSAPVAYAIRRKSSSPSLLALPSKSAPATTNQEARRINQELVCGVPSHEILQQGSREALIGTPVLVLYSLARFFRLQAELFGHGVHLSFNKARDRSRILHACDTVAMFCGSRVGPFRVLAKQHRSLRESPLRELALTVQQRLLCFSLTPKKSTFLTPSFDVERMLCFQTQCFITAMDALKLEQRAVDEVQPLIYDLSDRLNKVRHLQLRR